MKNIKHNHIIEQVPPDYYQTGVKKNMLQRIWHINKLIEVLKETKNFKTLSNVLDVGCASGWFVSEISKRYPEANYYGIDIYDKGIKYANKMYPHIKFSLADAHQIPYKNNLFDLVICTEVLEHVDDPKAVLLEIKRVLKKGGKAIIELDSGSPLFSIVWFLWRKSKGSVWDEAHVHSFNSKKLEKMSLDCGFKILKKRKFNLGMAMIFTLEKK